VRRTQSRDLADVDARLALLRGSYTEVLDATKHQDDKIGRLFTGVSFLTAAAIATANLGKPSYLSQRYTEFSTPVELPPLGILTLAVYLVLVIFCVMLLINSLATPLRTPGRGSRGTPVEVSYVLRRRVEPQVEGDAARPQARACGVPDQREPQPRRTYSGQVWANV
jgi:hypothetical protein